MPHFCSARGCANRCTLQTRSRGITFHRFPKECVLRRKWEAAIGRVGFAAGASSRLCSEHFGREDFDRTGQTVRIRDGTVPSVFSFKSHCKKPAAKRTTRTSMKARESPSAVCPPPAPVPETLPVLSADHSYALPTSPSDLRARLNEALARVESLEREKRNAKDRERRARIAIHSLLEDLRKKNDVNEELKERLGLYSCKTP